MWNTEKDGKCTDAEIFKLDSSTYSLLRMIVELFNDKNSKCMNSQIRDVDYDYNLIISFFSSKNKILIIPHTEIDEYIEHLSKYFKKFPYWDNSDRDDDVTVKEWSRRELLWSDAINKEQLTFNLYSQYDYRVAELNEPFISKLISHIETRDIRAHKLAKNDLLAICMKELSVEMDLNINGSIKASDFMHVYERARKEVNSDGRKEQLDLLALDWYSRIKDIDVNTALNYCPPK